MKIKQENKNKIKLVLQKFDKPLGIDKNNLIKLHH